MNNRLQELRTQMGVTQKAVAHKIGCTPKTYSRYERMEREPDIEMLKELSKFFDKSIDYIVCNDRGGNQLW